LKGIVRVKLEFDIEVDVASLTFPIPKPPTGMPYSAPRLQEAVEHWFEKDYVAWLDEFWPGDSDMPEAMKITAAFREWHR
jgi:hypothetical protein